MSNLPKDPIMLMSFVNMRLRDEFDTLEDFCAAYDVAKDELADKLAAAGFEYIETINQFR